MNEQELWLCFTLESSASFGSGDGIPGLIDRDIVHDRYGCPYLHGRTIKGLLHESCLDILFALGVSTDTGSIWSRAAQSLWGMPGSTNTTKGILHVGHGQLPAILRQIVQNEVNTLKWSPQDVLDSLTAIRRQTAINENGTPKDHSLRSMRVILRQTIFEAKIISRRNLEPAELTLLAATVKGFRRAGTARNRGRGLLSAHLEDAARNNVSELWFQQFCSEVTT